MLNICFSCTKMIRALLTEIEWKFWTEKNTHLLSYRHFPKGENTHLLSSGHFPKGGCGVRIELAQGIRKLSTPDMHCMQCTGGS